jgi:hypothetical protein
MPIRGAVSDQFNKLSLTEPRRLSPPWEVIEHRESFQVRTANGLASPSSISRMRTRRGGSRWAD